MDILEIISEKTTAIALAVVVMYFYNKLVIDVLKERKEIIDALRIERKEWIESNNNYIMTLFEINRTMTQAMTQIGAEVHALRNKLTEFMIKNDKDFKPDDK